MLFTEITAADSENYTIPINTLCGRNAELPNVKAGGDLDTVSLPL